MAVDDGRKLYKDYNVSAANLVELGALARAADPSFTSRRSIVSLARIIEVYCDGKVLDKGPVRMSDWERAPLSAEQLHCTSSLTLYASRVPEATSIVVWLTPPVADAANDAHSALMAYRRMMSIAAIHELTLDPTAYSSDVAHQAPAAQTSADVPEAELPPVSTASTQPKPPVTAPQPAAPPSPPRDDGPLPPVRLYPQYARAYRLWHVRDVPLDEICAMLRSKENPLQRSTVMFVCPPLCVLPPRACADGVRGYLISGVPPILQNVRRARVAGGPRPAVFAGRPQGPHTPRQGKQHQAS